MERFYFEKKMNEYIKPIGYICDMDSYALLFMTQVLMDLLEVGSRGEYFGRPCYKVIQGREEPCPHCTNEIIKKGEVVRWERYNPKLNRWFSLEDSAIKVNGKILHMEVGKDITNERTQINDMSVRLTEEEVLLSCLQLLSERAQTNDAMNQMLEMLGNFYQSERTYIFEFDFSKQTASNTFEWCRQGITPQIGTLQNVPMAYMQRWMDKFRAEGAFIISSVRQEVQVNSAEYRLLQAQGIRSLIVAPLLSGGNITGFLGADDTAENRRSLSLLRRMASFVANEKEKKLMFQELERQSHIDMLTGIYNRNRFIYMLNEFKEAPLSTCGVFYVDLNGMKNLNDTYGHAYGDQVLKQLAKVLEESFPSMAYRIGGDEFVVLCENMAEDVFLGKVKAAQKQLGETCDVSIGYNWYSGNPDIEKQVQEADELMYAQKQVYYKNAVSGTKARHPVFVTNVLEEIKDGNYVVYYQPQLSLKSGSIVGVEAIPCRRMPDGKEVMMDEFISHYETAGVMRHIDLFVFEAVCQQIKIWKGEVLPRVSVKVSRSTLLEAEIVSVLLELCTKYEISPGLFTLEITEVKSKLEAKAPLRLLRTLKNAGFYLSLDHFGAQQSNLSLLCKMKFDEVKIDKALVDELVGNPRGEVMVRHIISLCHDLGDTRVLAVGVTTEEQRKLLKACGCEYGQGNALAEPLSFSEFENKCRQAQG